MRDGALDLGGVVDECANRAHSTPKDGATASDRTKRRPIWSARGSSTAVAIRRGAIL